MIRIDYTDATPVYEQVVDRFKSLIVKGVLQPHEKVPSVRSLAMDLSINPNTIQKAYTALEQQGFLYSVKGRGNFVAENDSLRDFKKEEIVGKLQSVIDEAKSCGLPLSILTDYIERQQ